MKPFTAAAADVSSGPMDGTRRQGCAVLVICYCTIAPVMNYGSNNMHHMYYVTVSVAPKPRCGSARSSASGTPASLESSELLTRKDMLLAYSHGARQDLAHDLLDQGPQFLSVCWSRDPVILLMWACL